MQIRWIEDFLTLSDVRGFSRAAERRNVSQPTFSRHIQALEEWLGVALVDRRVQGVQLTPAGRIFRGFAADMLKQTYDMRTMLRGQSPSSDDVVRLSVAHTLSVTFFPQWLSELKQSLGDVVTAVNAVNVAEGANALKEGATDLLIVYHHANLPVLLEPSQFPHITLATEKMRPYSAPRADGRPRYSLPGRPGAAVPLLSYSFGAYLRHVVEIIMLASGERCSFTRSFDTHMAEALKAMIIEGHGLGWLPESCAGRDAAGGRLVVAGPSKWTCSLDIRLHRSLKDGNSRVDGIWDLLTRTAS